MQRDDKPCTIPFRSDPPHAMHLPPLQFEPILKPKVWGGRRLARYGKALPNDSLIGESWELADLPEAIPEGRSIILGGRFDGTPLRDLMRECQNEVMGSAPLSTERGFPLLIKFLDAQDNLSVQVHPDEAYVQRHPETHLKSEAWYVIEAAPDACIYAGVRPGVTPESFKAHIQDGTVVNDLIRVPVIAGDCHYLPSGTCHALGAGVLVAEVQTPSDTTFRVFDWGRTDRELHIEQALACIHFGEVREPGLPDRREPIETGGLRSQRLIACDHFEIERIEALSESKLEMETGGMPEVWMVLAGRVELTPARHPVMEIAPGGTALLPAAVEPGDALLSEGSRMLRISLPSPLKGLIA